MDQSSQRNMPLILMKITNEELAKLLLKNSTK